MSRDIQENSRHGIDRDASITVLPGYHTRVSLTLRKLPDPGQPAEQVVVTPVAASSS